VESKVHQGPPFLERPVGLAQDHLTLGVRAPRGSPIMEYPAEYAPRQIEQTENATEESQAADRSRKEQAENHEVVLQAVA
jgi:hypothetical protein